ncbi:LolA family protein [Rhodovibrionaceae bacterium A322]
MNSTRRLTFRSTAFLLAVTIGLWLQSPAQSRAAELSDADKADLARVADYLSSITTMKGKFLQVSSQGGYAEGEVMLRRPGRLRFEYNPPVPVLIIADGLALIYYDKELENATYLPLWDTPLWFLLGDEISLEDDVKVLGVTRGPATLSIRFAMADQPEQGTVEVHFSDKPLQLRKWDVVDAQGIVTGVSLLDPQFGVKIPPEAFSAADLPGVIAPPSSNTDK